jgi:hypothetical protein
MQCFASNPAHRKWGMLYGTVMSSAKKNYDVIFLLERII